MQGLDLLKKLQFEGNLRDGMDLAKVFGLHGMTLNKANRQDEALNSFFESFEIFDQLDSIQKSYYTKWFVQTKTNLANVYRALENFELAEKGISRQKGYFWI